MNIEKFKRNLQLYKLRIAELDGDEYLLYNFLINNLSDLNTYSPNNGTDVIYFGKSRMEIVLEYGPVYAMLWVDGIKIWKFLRDIIKLEVYDIQLIILWWVKNTLDIKHIMCIYPTYNEMGNDI